MQDLMTIKDASIWASKFIGKNVTPSIHSMATTLGMSIYEDISVII